MESNKTKEINLIKVGAICLSVIVVLTGLILLPFAVPLEKVSDSYTVELGDEISAEITDYVTGFTPGIWISNLDVTDVNTQQVGEYTATVKQGFHNHVFDVKVVDTTAPVLHFFEETFYLKENEKYNTDHFVKEAIDLSNEVSVFVSEGNLKTVKDSDICIGESGVYVLTFLARDKSGNESVYNLSVTVDTAPVIAGMKDYYVVPGTTLDYLEFITASDTVDGDMTGNVRTDASDVDLSSVGSYELLYICEDSYGLSSTEEVAVHVMEAIDIQELINHHEIHRLDEIIVGAYNLYDIGVYEGKTMEEMYEIMHPTAIRIAPSSNSYGSGFILEITDEEIIIGTCQHVVKSNQTVDVWFFDGTKVNGTVVSTVYKYDLGFVSVKRENVPKELMDQLYTVHIDKGYWDSLDNEADLEVGVRCINDKGQVWRDRKGKLVYKAGQTDLMWRSLPQVTRVSTTLFHGASGSGLFDINGNFMGVATYIISGSKRYESYCSTVETFCDAYEEVFERQIYYQ